MSGEDRKPYIGNADQLERAISKLEGWAFGRAFRFAVVNYALHFDTGSWTEIEGFRFGMPGLDEFAKELDAAVAPVCERYALKLRQELANECARVAERALDGKPKHGNHYFPGT